MTDFIHELIIMSIATLLVFVVVVIKDKIKKD
jgi:hypothetical protein